MFVHRSSDLESLVDALACLVRTPHPGGILAPEVVLIQSAGMERYLARGLSQRLGIAAQFQFPYPRAFLHQLLSLSEIEASYSKAALRWDYFFELQELSQKFAQKIEVADCFSEICEILADDPGGQKRLDLATQLAALTDQYLTFRKDMVLSWQGGQLSDLSLTRSNEKRWEAQSRLFRSIYLKKNLPHLGDKVDVFLRDGLSEAELAQAPRRISMIGGPGLPPLYLQVLSELSKQIEVHIFALSVSESYLGDAATRSVSLALETATPTTEAESSVTSGQLHPLLAAWGKVGSDFQHILEEATYQVGHEEFKPRGSALLLTALQEDLLTGTLRSPEQLLPASALEDGSLIIEAVHSPIRELEVLKQRIIGWMSEDASLRPDDIVILTPNMERYASLVPIVFDHKSGDESFIPYRVADQAPLNPAYDAVLRIFSALNSRLSTPEFLDLLHLKPVAARFDWEKEHLEQLRLWLTESQCAWGIEASDWSDRGIDIELAPTFELVLKRLVYGFTHRGDQRSLLHFEEGSDAGIAPFEPVSPSDADLIGQLYLVLRDMKALRRKVKSKKQLSLGTWLHVIKDLSNKLTIDSPIGEWEMSRALQKVEESLPSAEKRDEIFLNHRAMLRMLTECLEPTGNSANFLAGGLTFCNLLPLRTIPFRCICVMGMGQAEFPRSEPHISLDVMMSEPLPGDRSLRADDRYLFLELLLAAREKLALSYVGVDAATLREKPASSLIVDLQAVLSRMVASHDASAPIGVPVQVHPLQPYSIRYFAKEKGLKSYDRGAFFTAGALLNNKKISKLGLTERPLPPLIDSGENLALEELALFFSDVHKAYFQRVGIYLSNNDNDLVEREKWALEPLERYQILNELLGAAQESKGDFLEILKGSSRLPVGNIAELAYGEVQAKFEMIWRAMAKAQIFVTSREELLRWQHSLRPEPLLLSWSSVRSSRDSESEPSQYRLEGQLLLEKSGRYVELSPSKCDFSRKVRFMIRHLALCAAGLCHLDSAWLGVHDNQPKAFFLKPVQKMQAIEVLESLIDFRNVGLIMPLPFLGSLAESYIKSISGKEKYIAQDACVQLSYLDEFSEKAAKIIASDQVKSPYLVQAFNGGKFFGNPEQQEARFTLFHELCLRTQGLLQEFESAEADQGVKR